MTPSTTSTSDLLTPEVIAELKTGFIGALLRRGEEGYDQARAVWNGMIDKCPALIARCTNSSDVISAVRFARAHNLLVSVRGGGHNVAGNAVCADGLMIDLSPMKAIQVDVTKRTARAEAGVLWSELDQATQQHGLATTGGTVSHTGIAGLTLGGGLDAGPLLGWRASLSDVDWIASAGMDEETWIAGMAQLGVDVRPYLKTLSPVVVR